MAAKQNGGTPSPTPRKRTAQQVAQEAFENRLAEGDTVSGDPAASPRRANHRME